MKMITKKKDNVNSEVMLSALQYRRKQLHTIVTELDKQMCDLFGIPSVPEDEGLNSALFSEITKLREQLSESENKRDEALDQLMKTSQQYSKYFNMYNQYYNRYTELKEQVSKPSEPKTEDSEILTMDEKKINTDKVLAHWEYMKSHYLLFYFMVKYFPTAYDIFININKNMLIVSYPDHDDYTMLYSNELGEKMERFLNDHMRNEATKSSGSLKVYDDSEGHASLYENMTKEEKEVNTNTVLCSWTFMTEKNWTEEFRNRYYPKASSVVLSRHFRNIIISYSDHEEYTPIHSPYLRDKMNAFINKKMIEDVKLNMKSVRETTQDKGGEEDGTDRD